MPVPDAEVGSASNSYEVLAKLATGGMAEIFLARGMSATGVERHVVLKRILRERASDANFVRMFLDEARLAAQLQHPNIAQVYDIGKLGDSYFFTMEYVHGETVRALLQRASGLRRPMPIPCALLIALGTAAGLHHAHERVGLDGKPLGIVHRDVSPSNVMVSYEGHVKLVDFGVAKAADRLQETRAGTVKGKISYLSPEQCRGSADIDRRSDVFSLGIVLWEILTTQRLFRRGSDFETMTAIVKDEVPAPSTKRADIPPELDAIVLRMLAQHVDDRYQSANEVVEAIDTVAAAIGAAMSNASLGRQVKELFGQRPEPWIEVAEEAAETKPVTVTSEPVPLDLALPASDVVARQLASVADLSSARSGPMRTPTTSSPAFATPPSGSAVPRVIADDARFDASSDQIPTNRDPARVTATTPDPLPTDAATSTGVTPTDVTSAGEESQVSRSEFDAPTTPRMPNPTAPSVSDVHALSRSVTDLVQPRRSRIVIITAVAAVAIGIGLFIAFAGHSGPASAPATAADSAPVTSSAPADSPAPVVVAQGSAGSAAGSATVEPEPAPDVAAMFTANKFDAVVSACASAVTFAQHRIECTLAACRMHDAKKARTFYTSVPAAERAKVASGCQKDKIVLEVRPVGRVRPPTPPTPKPDCVANPLDCQR